MAARGREAGLICLSSLFLIAVASIILLPPNCKRFHLYDVLSVIWCEMQALLALLQWGLIFFNGQGLGGNPMCSSFALVGFWHHSDAGVALPPEIPYCQPQLPGGGSLWDEGGAHGRAWSGFVQHRGGKRDGIKERAVCYLCLGGWESGGAGGCCVHSWGTRRV